MTGLERLAAMGDEALVGQLVMPIVMGAKADRADLARRAATGRIGGLLLFGGDSDTVPAILDEIGLGAPVPLWVASDMERGAGQQVSGATVLPPLMAIGAADDPVLAARCGALTAREARSLGVHVVFGPVLDVNLDRDNPIINTRAFGSDPRRVAAMGAAYVEGMQATGALACGKHFPGHGRTSSDTHLGYAKVDGSLDLWGRTDRSPFDAAIRAGLATIMTGHVHLAALDPTPMPATLSVRAIDGLLRRDLGFGGVVFTDAMLMGAVRETADEVEAARLALAAGCDCLLAPVDAERLVSGLAEDMRSGRLQRDRVLTSVRRVLAAKARIGPAASGGEDGHALAMEVARRSQTIVRPAGIPLGRESLAAIAVTEDATEQADAWAAALAARGVWPCVVGPFATQSDLDAAAGLARSAREVVVGVFADVRAWKGRSGMDPARAAWIQAMAAERPLVLVSFGSPYILGQVPAAAGAMVAWDSGPACAEAATAVLLDGVPASGRLPVDL